MTYVCELSPLPIVSCHNDMTKTYIFVKAIKKGRTGRDQHTPSLFDGPNDNIIGVRDNDVYYGKTEMKKIRRYGDRSGPHIILGPASYFIPSFSMYPTMSRKPWPEMLKAMTFFSPVFLHLRASSMAAVTE